MKPLSILEVPLTPTEHTELDAAKQAVDDARRLGHQPRWVEIGKKRFTIEEVDRYALDQERWSGELSRSFANKAARILGRNVGAFEQEGPNERGRVGDFMERMLAKLYIKVDVGKKQYDLGAMIRKLKEDAEKVAQHLGVTVGIENDQTIHCTKEGVARAATRDLNLFSAVWIDALSLALGLIPLLPLATLVMTQTVGRALKRRARKEQDPLKAAALASMVTKTTYLGVVADVDPFALPSFLLSVMTLAWDLGEAAMQLEPPTARQMNELHKYVSEAQSAEQEPAARAQD